MVKLEDIVDDADACYIRAKDYSFRFVLKTRGTCLDLEVQRNEMGLQCLVSDIGRVAGSNAVTWMEAAVLTQWVRRSFLAIGS